MNNESHPGMLVRKNLLACIEEANPPVHRQIMSLYRERHGSDSAQTAESILRNMVSSGALLIGQGAHLILPDRSKDITG